MTRLGSIQRLRAIAAIGVALFHACQWSGVDFAVGAAGVDIFFVISGFVLWTAAQARPVSPGAFLAARLARVAPLYWLVTLAVTALVLWRPQAMSVAHFTPSHLILSLLLVPHNDPVGDAFPMVASGWTLTYEAFFYLALALTLAVPKDRRFQVMSLVLLAASVIGLGYHSLYPLLANPLLLEFLAGIGLARLWARGRLQRIDPRWGWGITALGALVLFGLQVGGVRDDFWRPFLWGPPAALIVAGALKLEAAGRLGHGRLGRALEGLGDASYSIYLCQLPVIAVFAWLTRGQPALVRAPLALALAIAAGLACYALVEKPIGRALRSVDRRRRILEQDRHGRGLGPPEQVALAAVDADLA
ncbi:MAG: acyltransferase [Caulobacteraceae bacterium]|nr:acyltransferase [Caulobacteraceae bacterium]